MKQHLSALCAVAVAGSMLAVPTAPLSAQDGDTYVGDSDWAVDYGEDYCRLLRDFSNGRDRISLMLERTAPGPFMRMIVVGDSVRTFRGADQVGYSLLPTGGTRMVQKIQVQTADRQQALNLGTAMLADMAPPAAGSPPAPPPPYARDAETSVASNVNGIALTTGLSRPIRIETGALDAPIEALQICADELVDYWGRDAEAHKTLSRPAGPAGPSAWLPDGTVGFADFARLNGGNNEVRVLIDAEGKPTDCHILWPTLNAATNESICGAVMEKGSFNPALDASGQPIASYWTTSVFMLMPRR